MWRHLRPSVWSAVVGAFGYLVLSTVAGAARAQAPDGASGAAEARVVLLTDGSALAHVDEAATRFAAELRAAGFVLERITSGGSPGQTEIPGQTDTPAQVASPAQVEDEARQRNAYAGLHIHGDAQVLRADVWLDGTRVHPGARRLSVEGSAASPGDFALQLVEYLQAGLSEVRARSMPAGQPVSRPTPPPEPAGARGSGSIPSIAHGPPLGVVLEAGARALSSPRAGDLLLGVQLGGGYLLAESILIGARTTLPLHDERYDAAQGSAYYQLWMAQLRLEGRLVRWRRLSVAGALGAGVARLSARGEPAAPLRSRSEAVWSAVGSAELGLHVALLSRLALMLDAGLAWWAPHPEVAIAQDSRTLGAPMLSLGLGLRVTP